MVSLTQAITKLIGRWSRQQDSALGQMTERKTPVRRIAGFSKSERVDAKFFLLALTPFVPVVISDELGWSRGVLWHAWFWLSAVWAVAVISVGLVSYCRTFGRSLHRKP